MTLIRFVSGALGLFLTGCIVWAFGASSFWDAFSMISNEPWGFVTLVDLYLGFFFIAVLIALVERNWTAALWIIPLPFLGNVWTAIWFVVRLPHIWRRISAARPV